MDLSRTKILNVYLLFSRLLIHCIIIFCKKMYMSGKGVASWWQSLMQTLTTHSWGAWPRHGSLFWSYSRSSILSIFWHYRFLWTKKTQLASVHAGLGTLSKHHRGQYATRIKLTLVTKVKIHQHLEVKSSAFFTLGDGDPLEIFSFCLSVEAL